MHFCKVCGFMYRTQEIDGKLKFVCDNCGNEEDNNEYIIESMKVLDSSLDNINTDIVYDPTFSRTNKKKCPNKECPTHKSTAVHSEAIIMRDKDLKIIYICVHCKTLFSV